jgi:hypothetical protein
MGAMVNVQCTCANAYLLPPPPPFSLLFHCFRYDQSNSGNVAKAGYVIAIMGMITNIVSYILGSYLYCGKFNVEQIAEKNKPIVWVWVFRVHLLLNIPLWITMMVLLVRWNG